jgi:AraC family transcriptional regulator, L-rhamnose operon transcriptional activator RhaR
MRPCSRPGGGLPFAMPDPLPTTQIAWSDYHQSVRRIAAKFNQNHGNYGIHDHEFIEIAFIAAGTCLHHSVLGDSRPGPGDVFLFRPGAWHGYAEVQGLCLYNCCFDTALLGKELSWMADEPFLGRLLWAIPLAPKQHGMLSLHLPDPNSKRCRRLFDDLCSIAQEDYLSHFGDHLGLLVQILSLLARHVAEKPGAKPHRAVITALTLIDDAPTEPWTLKTLAGRVHVEPTYFVRLFHAVVGLPPMAYLERRRLELATTFLRHDDLAIGDVGEMAGWLDANYFSRCFRRHFGMTPSRYRARFRNGQPPSAASRVGIAARSRGCPDGPAGLRAILGPLTANSSITAYGMATTTNDFNIIRRPFPAAWKPEILS